MSAKSPPCVFRARVDRHFDGELSPSDERALREHLPSCDPCKSRYERQLLLARIDPEALDARDRIGRGLGFAAERAARGPSPRNWLGPVVATAGAMAAAAAILLFALPSRERGADQGFQARGGGEPAAGAGFVVYRVAGERLVAAGETIRADDELAFAYENPRARKRLVIFAIDDRRRVYWYHPAWTDPATDPIAIDARTGSGLHTLGEAVRHRFDPGSRVRICAVLTDESPSVRAVERALDTLPSFATGRERSPDVSPALQGGVATCTSFGVAL